MDLWESYSQTYEYCYLSKDTSESVLANAFYIGCWCVCPITVNGCYVLHTDQFVLPLKKNSLSYIPLWPKNQFVLYKKYHCVLKISVRPTSMISLCPKPIVPLCPIFRTQWYNCKWKQIRFLRIQWFCWCMTIWF